MKRKKLSPCNANLPLELVTEVLARLRVKSVLRFRSVCKSWLSLISSPDFASLHLARFHKDYDDENTPVLTLSHRRGTKWMLRSTHTFNTITSKHCRKLHAHDFKWPDDYKPCGNSVNGLILLFKCPSEIMLWNPILGKTHKLPKLWIETASFGLGFSLSSDDYKVVAIEVNTISSMGIVHIYTLSTRTWRRIVDYRESILCNVQSHGVLIDGTLFWLTKDYQKKNHQGSQMVSFDVNDEVFDCVTLPSVDSDVYRRHPVAYRNWVGLLDVYVNSCSLWVMEKYQMPRAWTKLYTIDLQTCNPAGIFRSAPRILCFKKNGQSIIASNMLGMELFNIETQDMKDLNKSYRFCYPMSARLAFYCTLFKESLVLL